MRRVISLWLPTFQTDRLRRLSPGGTPSASQPDAPLVIAERRGGRRELVAVNAAAREAGLRVGMGVAHATALQANLAVVDSDPEADATLLARLAAWSIRYTPLAGIDPPDGLWLDATGCAHLYGGERKLLQRLKARFHAMGFATVASIADTAGAAHAAARFTKGGIVPKGSCEELLRTLPIAALRLPPEMVSGLRGLGFEGIQQLLDCPPGPLTRRFGALPRLRLDQALGRVGEPLQPLDPPPMPRCRRGFLEPIATAESFAQVTRDLAQDLCRLLEEAGQGARRLDLIFHRIDGVRLSLRAGTVRPLRDPLELARLLTERLDNVEPGFGVEAMELAAPRVEPLDASQMSTLDEQRHADVADLIDRLGNRIGERRLWRISPQESHTPERSIAPVAPHSSPRGVSWPADLPRPIRLIDPPEQVEVIAQVPDYPPSLFRWRGRRYRIRQSDGLERIFGDWWEGGPLYGRRDYYRVEVEEGGRYWLFRARDEEQGPAAPSGWFIHGAFA